MSIQSIVCIAALKICKTGRREDIPRCDLCFTRFIGSSLLISKINKQHSNRLLVSMGIICAYCMLYRPILERTNMNISLKLGTDVCCTVNLKRHEKG